MFLRIGNSRNNQRICFLIFDFATTNATSAGAMMVLLPRRTPPPLVPAAGFLLLLPLVTVQLLRQRAGADAHLFRVQFVFQGLCCFEVHGRVHFAPLALLLRMVH